MIFPLKIFYDYDNEVEEKKKKRAAAAAAAKEKKGWSTKPLVVTARGADKEREAYGVVAYIKKGMIDAVKDDIIVLNK